MTYADLIDTLLSDFNISVADRVISSQGKHAVVLENATNGLEVSLSFLPHDLVEDPVLTKIQNRLNLSPHPIFTR